MLDHRVKLSARPPAARPGQAELTAVVADDHPGVVGHLRGLLTDAGITVVAEAANGRQAVRDALLHAPDVLVLDLRMSPSGGDGVDSGPEKPGPTPTSGIEAIREVLRAAPGMAVLVFTACDDDESVLTAMRAGVRGYILKCASDDDIVRAVRGVASGGAIFGQDIARRVIDLLASPGAARPLPVLTARERDILELLDTGLGNAAIAARLRIAPKTVGNIIYAVLAKLGVSDRAAAIARVRDSGGCR